MNVIHLNDFVIFRKHLCIGFELMSMNLFEFLKINDFNVSSFFNHYLSFKNDSQHLPYLLTLAPVLISFVYRASTTTWFVDSQYNCSTLLNTSKCSRLSTVTWNRRTSCSRSPISLASRSSTLAALPSWMSAFIPTSSRGSIAHRRSC